MNIERFRELAPSRASENKKFLKALKKQRPENIDRFFHSLHQEVFETTDCLECANCCKTTSPIFTNHDIDRLARHFRMKPGRFVEQYLKIDSEGDYVLKDAPCPFLDEQNYCSVYAERPKACREYPHTDRKKMVQILDLTQKNALVCPAVFEIVEKMKAATL